MERTEISRVADALAREAAFAVRKAVFVDEQKIGLSVEFDGLDATAEHLIAKIDGHAVGTLRLRTIDQTTAKIERVAVIEAARGRAVGAALVRAALAHLRNHGFLQAKLHAQTHALDFYAKLGFVARGEVFDEDGIPHRDMRVDLTNPVLHAGGGE